MVNFRKKPVVETPVAETPVVEKPVAERPDAQQPAAKKRVGIARILLGIGALLSIALGGSIGADVVHGMNQRNQQATAQALVAAKAASATKSRPQTAGVNPDGSHYGPLFAYLAPLPAGYTLGPDYCGMGNNESLTGSQITDETDLMMCGQPQTDVSGTNGGLVNYSIQNAAVRSYANVSSTLVVQIALIQTDVNDATLMSEALSSTISSSGFYRQGPIVPGYSQATCALPSSVGSDTLDSMICLGQSGDIEVRAFAYGSAPLDQNTIAQLVSEQLELLTTTQTIG